ncbi:chorismate--pyruvate lyase family protein [Cupriavidus plantarum]|uniref:chorismate--pyruvate lyase family protein n=1 Tax=Cupriavidus plantarum TaxID=942865 RepID=UPI001AFDBD29|nr:chorismate lyase [Cupriavidus plantarum]CAG2141635.1 Chorismate pyruvate-lyase [Cupriavidus plantarum]SMR65339.1 chorismate lyase [Cupriavidus plantarum]
MTGPLHRHAGVARARGGGAWQAHLPYDATISPNLRRWVTGDAGSLTARLISASAQFRVARLAQRLAMPYADEWRALGLPAPAPVLTREVMLICDEVTAIYAHTIVIARHARRDWPFLRGLGERPLGGRLFVDPRVSRTPFEFARLRPDHPMRVAMRRVLPDLARAPMLPARRSVFHRGGGAMLVTEVFLPDLQSRPAPVRRP